MAVREGKWDCSQCRTMGIAGRELNCPECGDARNPLLDPEEKPYLPADAPVVDDAEGLKLAESGPNWNCGKCGQANIGTAEVCSSCLEPRGSNDDVAGTYTYVSGVDAEGVSLTDPEQITDDRVDTVLQGADKLQQLEEGPVVMPSRTLSLSSLPRQGVIALRTATHATYKRTFPQGMHGARVLVAIGVVVGLVLTIFGGNFLYANYIKTYTVDLTVQELTWERQIEVEVYRTFTEEDWSVPSGGRIQNSYRAIHHYDRVLDHYEKRSRQVGERVRTGSHQERYVCGSRTVDNGNGFFTTENTYCERTVDDYSTVYHTEYYDEPIYRQDPVYRTKYVYDIDRWVTDHFEKASGETDPHWPDMPTLRADQRVGNERRESYDVVLTDDDGREFERDLDESVWSRLSEDEVVEAQQTRKGAVREIDWPAS